MVRILVISGAGYVGSSLFNRLSESEAQVGVRDNLIVGHVGNASNLVKSPGVEFIGGAIGPARRCRWLRRAPMRSEPDRCRGHDPLRTGHTEQMRGDICQRRQPAVHDEEGRPCPAYR